MLTDHERFRGCLLGGAIGDALGAPIEFIESLEELRAKYGPDGISDFDLAYGRRGAITDDTQMTLFTAEGLLQANALEQTEGRVHLPTVVHRAYLRWLRTQDEASMHPDYNDAAGDGWLINVDELHARRAPGLTCLTALMYERMGTMSEPLNDSKGCGGVMRVAPVGLIAPPETVFRLGCEVAALTHSHPSGYLSAGALAMLISLLREGSDLPHALDAVEQALDGHDGAHECIDALRDAHMLAADGDPSPEKLESLGGGWVGEEAFAMSIYCALAFPNDFAAAVLLAVNHSGDSDSTGAITGNILGVMHGEGAIPTRWSQHVELRDVVLEVADELYAGWRGEGSYS